MSGVSFSVVTVLYNSNSVIFDMLRSIPPETEIILIDNGDEQLEQSLLTTRTKYLKSVRNIGFGRACNDGAREATGDFLLFLNPDVILRPDFFEELTRAIQTHTDCGVFCAATYVQGDLYFSPMTWIESQLKGERLTVAKSQNLWGDCCVRFANGGAFAIRRSLFAKLGGFDPNIFLYLEDDDLSWRLIQRGEPIILVAAAKVDHNLGTSTCPSCATEFLRGYGKESSIIYLRGKYQLPDRPIRMTAKILKRMALYGLAINLRRFFHQAGRALARIEKIRLSECQISPIRRQSK